MKTDYSAPPYKEFAIGIAMRAGTILMRNFADSQKIRSRASKKSRYELVTKSDMEVHRFLKAKIRKQFPQHNFISEEGDHEKKGDSEYTWLVDPLDGTLNYTIANPFFTTNITLLHNDQPVITVIYAPYTREMFVAEKNQSVRLNERNIHVSGETKLQNSVLSFAYFRRDEKSRRKSMKVWDNFDTRAQSMRHLGCTSLEFAYVACGRMEAVMISPPGRLWDIAGGMLMVEAAGGKITNFAGKSWQGLQEGIIASNGLVHSKILNVLKKHNI
jgi:myo-inositol-1(or 4)-monophosphatase